MHDMVDVLLLPPYIELSLFLGGQFLSNHAIVTPSDIGETNNALLCLTPVLDCCDSSNGLAGDWFYPNTGVVARNGFGLPLFRNRGPSVVRLNRVADSVGSGVYRCELLSAVGVSVSLHVGLYPLGEGECALTTSRVPFLPHRCSHYT